MIEQQVIKSYRNLKVYERAYQLAMDIFNATKCFPKEETYSLVDQIRRSSRSVPGNIREGYAKRKYQYVFVRHLNDALGSAEETRTWLEFAHDCQYIPSEQFTVLEKAYDGLSAMLYTLMDNWQTFEPSGEL